LIFLAAKKEFCEITSLPAKYKDPMTNVPYATAAAFSSVRSRYSFFFLKCISFLISIRLNKKPETPNEEMKRKRGRPPLIRSPTPT
jgi:hypothetical protein